MVWVIYWEKGHAHETQRGFVSYNNKLGEPHDEYNPLMLESATKYKNKKDAEKTRDWYRNRGGYGIFQLMKLE